MRRVPMLPRPDWRQKCEQVGFTFYDMPSENNEPYWRENAAYELSMAEVDTLEAETQELIDRCLEAVNYAITHNRMEEFGIPKEFWPAITASWQRKDPTVFGRFDLAWQPDGPAKLLEYNADTPTSLIESSVVQWFWMKDMFGDTKDQFNSIHERLIAEWAAARTTHWRLPEGAPLHMASLRDNGDGVLLAEDYDNVAYMAEVAQAAGFKPQQLFIEDIGWSDQYQAFIDSQGKPIRSLYKLYPWEWLVHEAFAPHIISSQQRTKWMEPLWKMLLSNKQLLVLLWELFPGHPNLLPAFNTDVPLLNKKRVRKPRLGREGANVHIFEASGALIESVAGGYGNEGHVWQEYVPLPTFDGWHAVIGSWIVGKEPAGIDFRETSGLVTGDMAFFVPHYINEPPAA
ncbi:MAG TPA: glutathionylspermidine synthase family protein [Candidatus Saccharimonadales bacterium]|nr:glutathionylspermidine synthase family protein [Candidatus Saccharimonadales bacterium]